MLTLMLIPRSQCFTFACEGIRWIRLVSGDGGAECSKHAWDSSLEVNGWLVANLSGLLSTLGDLQKLSRACLNGIEQQHNVVTIAVRTLIKSA